ncbi:MULTISPECIES: hypothetical protein [Bradyrhizobium]|uniref:Uncharacterized protein n=1 Tax=Bradyrhizobium frederickii TaxID=2560054 RepID=A0A4Y9KUZ1_9BRAD|nr:MULTISPECIES: hypothetical protein [Bradyrhizobium]RTE88330.1 hypothetical protein D6B98_36340 [Bradyrhizobium sp. LVM 105]TFV30311.1 hypothetical protein E4K66_35545 [Bradyrhizobium frederickii]TFV70185.1 hypothetical protein E4K64_30440 [Bradyrhizobium frederickii]
MLIAGIDVDSAIIAAMMAVGGTGAGIAGPRSSAPMISSSGSNTKPAPAMTCLRIGLIALGGDTART